MQDDQPLTQLTPHAEPRPGLSRVEYHAPPDRGTAMAQQFGLFSGLSPADCAGILSIAHERTFLRRQMIFVAGDPIHQMWLLTSGYVKVMQLGPNGAEVILRLNGPGEVVGALGFCSRGRHCSTAQAVQASKALAWDATAFEAIAERFPALRRNITRILGERLQEMEERFREMSTERVAARLGSQLIRLWNQVGKQVQGAVEISLSREELAQLTGTTLFTVSRLLCQWEQRGILSARRELVLIHDVQALMSLSAAE